MCTDGVSFLCRIFLHIVCIIIASILVLLLLVRYERCWYSLRFHPVKPMQLFVLLSDRLRAGKSASFCGDAFAPTPTHTRVM